LARLPNAEKAIIEDEKIRDYILSPTHPVGQFKAAVFRKLGYSYENWEEFEQDLKKFILSYDAQEIEVTRFGRKFIVEGSLAGPSGRTMQIITVWVILKSESIPRFVTAYPGG
jgi:filamentous hemagglutinin